MRLTNRELATVLAALRHWQATTTPESRRELPHFYDVVPLSDAKIDELCDRLNEVTCDRAESRAKREARRGARHE